MSLESWFYPVLALAGFAAIDIFAVNVILVSRWRELGARRTLRLALGISGAMLIVFSLFLGVVIGIAAEYERGSCDGPPPRRARAIVDPAVPLTRPCPDARIFPPARTNVDRRYGPGTLVVARKLTLTLPVRNGWFTAVRPATGRAYSFRFPLDYRLAPSRFDGGELYDVIYRVDESCPTGVFSCGELVRLEPLIPPALDF